MKRGIVAFIGIAVVILVSFAAVPRLAAWQERQVLIAEQAAVQLPPVQHINSSSPSSASVSAPSAPSSIPPALSSSVNWDVPFTSQAPTGSWDPPYDEACEEASVVMAIRYFRGQSFASKEDADRAIVAMAEANALLRFPIDDTADQVRTLLESQDPSLTVSLLRDPTVEQMQGILRSGSLIIVPLAGREVGNPYYRRPGPLYHMLVLRGFTDDGYAITNDPGTKRGEAFVYRWDMLLNAIHDWNGGDVENGERVVVVVGK